MHQGIDIAAFVVYLVGVNAVAFAAFGVDKSRAKRGAWRITESALLLLAAMGGSLGALVAMHVFHHKTRKPKFAIGVPALLVMNVAVLVWVAVAGGLSGV